jgi:hypothetical protein
MRPSTRKSLILSLPLLIGALIAIGALTGCGPERVSATPAMVSYNVTGSNLAEANERAADYCRNQAMPPRLVSVQNGVATYACGSSTTTVPPQTSPISPTPIQ